MDGDFITPAAHVVAIDGTNFNSIVRVGSQTSQGERIAVGCNRIVFIAIDAELPSGGAAVFGPAQFNTGGSGSAIVEICRLGHGLGTDGIEHIAGA